jgi:hypothetical protein
MGATMPDTSLVIPPETQMIAHMKDHREETTQNSDRERARRYLSRSVVLYLTVAAVYLATANYATNGRVVSDVQRVSAAAWLTGGKHIFEVFDRFPGAILMGIPSYLFSSLFSGKFSIVPASVTAALVTALTVTLAYRLLLRLFASNSTALAGAVLFGFATPTWNVSAAELWQHTGTQLCLVVLMLAVEVEAPLVAGLATAAAVLFRPHLGVIALFVAWHYWRKDGRRYAIRYLIPSALGPSILVLWNLVSYREFTVGIEAQVSPLGVGPLAFIQAIGGTLLSPERGLLVTCPILLVCIPHLRRTWRSAPTSMRNWTLAGLAYLATQLWLIRYSGGDGFSGNRVTLESLTLALPLLIASGRHYARRHPRATWALAGYSILTTAMAALPQSDLPGDNLNPWTNWSPLLEVQTYPVAAPLGAFLALTAIVIAYYAWKSHRNVAEVSSPVAGNAEWAERTGFRRLAASRPLNRVALGTILRFLE